MSSKVILLSYSVTISALRQLSDSEPLSLSDVALSVPLLVCYAHDV